jgi:glyceraldehyde 3-phosphate dehydrogenase
MIKVINDLCGIEQAYITTIHSTQQTKVYTINRTKIYVALVEQVDRPTTTGAAKALTKIFPEFEGKIGGCGIRVPVPDG